MADEALVRGSADMGGEGEDVMPPSDADIAAWPFAGTALAPTALVTFCAALSEVAPAAADCSAVAVCCWPPLPVAA